MPAVTGLQSIGVTGLRMTVTGKGDAPGDGETSATIDGYWGRTDATHPQWARIDSDTSYTFTVAAHDQACE
ncbi:hypothetical protein ACIA8E_21450 [Streptomyces sp. NPDC051664]|uniref:hypothetical protein n=1 Tax=Streptomyces sp. NPDC051664 TaxID=3365668 RepID=UPI0037B6A368